MKLIKIEPDVNAKAMIFGSGKKLLPVTLTYKKFWSEKEVHIKAFPTSYGPVFDGTNNINYYMFVNELGEELSHDTSAKINRFLFTYFNNHE